MKIRQIKIRKAAQLAEKLQGMTDISPGLLLVFGDIGLLNSPNFAGTLQAAFPGARLLGCSTAGEISGDGVDDGSCVVTAVELSSTRLTHGSTRLANMADSFAAGVRLGEAILASDLKAVMVFGPGIQINGSALVNGLSSVVGQAIPITGGLAGDGGAFQATCTLGPNGVSADEVVAIGLCGERLNFGHGSFGGWEAFGPARKVTRCEGNVLYELDGEPALEIYKRYLGEHASGLPASGLLFPFAMLGESEGEAGLIRTILGIDEQAGSLTLAGEINADGYLKLMHASTDKLVNGAEAAADAAARMAGQPGDALAILVSCVGRKLVMGSRVDEEVEAVADVLGQQATLTGFYSYGEISPFTPGAACKLHNQTMTITCLSER